MRTVAGLEQKLEARKGSEGQASNGRFLIERAI
jgi:hypothetical protein